MASRRLCIVADDFGYGKNRNHGIIECFKKGAISIASLLPNCKHSLSAVSLAKKHGLPLGLHFNITEGYPLSKPNDVLSLLNKDGTFLGKYEFWKNELINPDHVKIELNAQIKWFQNQMGTIPERVDGHHHVHICPSVADVFAKTLSNYGIRNTRLPVEHLSSIDNGKIALKRQLFHETVVNASKKAASIFQNYDLYWMDSFIGLNLMGSAMMVSKLQNILNEVFVDNNTCEIMTHPGYVSDLNTDGFMGEKFADQFSLSSDREHELNVLTRTKLLQFYKSKEIITQWN